MWGSRRPLRCREWACESGKAVQGLLGKEGARTHSHLRPEPRTQLARALAGRATPRAEDPVE